MLFEIDLVVAVSVFDLRGLQLISSFKSGCTTRPMDNAFYKVSIFDNEYLSRAFSDPLLLYSRLSFVRFKKLKLPKLKKVNGFY